MSSESVGVGILGAASIARKTCRAIGKADNVYGKVELMNYVPQKVHVNPFIVRKDTRNS